jgi:PadR family transcriptional regulator, regulatory protein PadR
MQTEALKSHVDLLLLAVVADEPAHGYRIVELLRDRSDGVFDLAEGTVYPALYRLERQGLVASRWSDGDGRRRRVYRVTAAGRRELVRRRRSWERFEEAVRAVLT